ncbi:unnamed protein product [Effrenium voratum]|uniref:Uncharacterized protein n=1 Tax=Effrenium voratum TaxID=2562239 RepID=A0AA36HQZ5_9DINO|nr:unnamed protein product [Effrenium voratum]
MAKFEEAEFKPFEGERKELERRSVTETVLNWSPEPVSYAPHCLARESREKIIGAEPVEGEHYLSNQEKQKDVVGACYHALGVDSTGAAAVETWGEDGVPGKKNTDWQEPHATWIVSMHANPSFPGLTADAVWDCSTRDINRGWKMANWERQTDMATDYFENAFEPAYKTICSSIVGVITLAGAIAAYAGTKNEVSDICESIGANAQGGALYALEVTQDYRNKRFIESDFADCNPLQNTMAKVYCDLACVEDAVKRGDQQILSSIGTMNHNILSEMKAFFDHYVSEIFVRLTHIEDKSSHETQQLKQAMDTYAKADIDAVNSNGKQIISAMNSQHSAINKNLGDAAKQIFDLNHEEHKIIAAKMDAHLDATTDAIDKLQESTVQGFSDAFSEFSDSLQDLHKLHNATRNASEDFSTWAKDSMHKMSGERLQQIHQSLQRLLSRIRSRKQANATLHDVWSLHQDAQGTLQDLLSFRSTKHSATNPAPRLDADMKKLLKAAELSIQSHHLSSERMGKRMGAMQSSAASRWFLEENLEMQLQSQLVQFDKVLLSIRQAAEDYLDAASEQVELTAHATELTNQYLSECSADYWELQLASQKAMSSGKKAAKQARVAVSHVTQQVGLLADVVVDGGLLRSIVEEAALKLSRERLDSAPQSSVPIVSLHKELSGVHTQLFRELARRMRPIMPRAWAALQLVQDLQMRQEMHGMARAGVKDAELMLSSWQRLDAEMQEVVRSARTPDSALGTVFKKHLEEALLTRAKAPEECEAAGWALWGNLTKDSKMSEVVLVKGMAQLLLESEGRNGTKFDLASETGAMVCSLQPQKLENTTLSRTRPLRAGEMVVCLNEMEPGCNAVLPNGKSALNAAVLWGV